MEAIPWFAWIAIAGMAGWALIGVVGALTGSRGKKNEELTEALRANTDANKKVTERLDGIEQRMSTIEKTLNDIP